MATISRREFVIMGTGAGLAAAAPRPRSRAGRADPPEPFTTTDVGMSRHSESMRWRPPGASWRRFDDCLSGVEIFPRVSC